MKFINVDAKYPDNELFEWESEPRKVSDPRAALERLINQTKPRVGEYIFVDTCYEIVAICTNVNHGDVWYYLKMRLGYTPGEEHATKS